MNVSPGSPVTFQDPFTADQVWKAIDAQLAQDVRRPSVATASSSGSRGQARMRAAFVRRASEEVEVNIGCWSKFKGKLKDWL